MNNSKHSLLQVFQILLKCLCFFIHYPFSIHSSPLSDKLSCREEVFFEKNKKASFVGKQPESTYLCKIEKKYAARLSVHKTKTQRLQNKNVEKSITSPSRRLA